MGQKVHPIGIRLGITKEWASKWYANTQTFPDYIEQDHRVREFLNKRLKDASVSRIHIERPAKRAIITIHTALLVFLKTGIALLPTGTRAMSMKILLTI